MQQVDEWPLLSQHWTALADNVILFCAVGCASWTYEE